MNTKKLKKQGIEKITEGQLNGRYCEFLNDIYGTTKIAGLEYETARALSEIDPTAFRCGFNDWIDAELGETLIEIEGKYFDKSEVDALEEK